MLKIGTKVKVKSKEEIDKTLDGDSHCGTVYFDPNMYAFCGQSLTLTAYFDNGSYSTKETFYNWRPEWFDVVPELESLFEDDIWSGTFEDKILNLAMLHQVESGNAVNLSLLKKYVEDHSYFPSDEDDGFSYSDYPDEYWIFGKPECTNPPNYKWLNLKPGIVEKIIKEVVNQNAIDKLKQYPEDSNAWFLWISSNEGANFWSNFHKKYQSNTKQNLTQNERNQIKLQRKKTFIRVGTVPEGCRVHGKRCKASVRCRYLSYSARVGY